MVIVLDACVAARWYVHEEGRERALALLQNSSLEFVAPDIFLPEVTNALLKHHRAGEFGTALVHRAFANLKITSPRLVASAPFMDEAFELAIQLRHPVNDCLYLVLAESLNTRLVTADVAFVTRCRERLKDHPIVTRLRTLEEFP